jgi:hypothetical protein
MNYITYYYDKDITKSTFYFDCYQKLKTQLEFYSDTLIGENINFSEMSLDAYDKLNLYKPTYILKKIYELNTPVIWIDADTTINSKIIEFKDISCDIGFAIREHDNRTPHAAIIYFSNTKKSIDFLLEWEKLCNEKKYVPWNCTEHCLLVDLFNQNSSNASMCKFYNLASIGRNTKISIGISPAGWEYERNKKVN